MAWRQVWMDEGECKTCLNYGPGLISPLPDKITQESKSENTGFCMIYWTKCTCQDCGRTWEES